MKGLTVFLASVAGLAGAITAFVGVYLLLSGQGLVGMVVGGAIVAIGLTVIGLGVWSTRT
jgi:hypothetical protein